MITKSVNINFPDQETFEEFCTTHGYTGFVKNLSDPKNPIDVPETKTQFFKRVVKQYIKGTLIQRRMKKAMDDAETARIQALKNVNNIVISSD